MRIPVPKSSLLTLALVGAVLTGALTVGLANPDAVAHYRNDTEQWLTTHGAFEIPATAAGSDTVAEVSEPIAEPAVTPTATPAATPMATPTTPATPQATPAPTPTPVANFTPEVQQQPAPAAHGDDDGYEHEEHEEHEEYDDD